MTPTTRAFQKLYERDLHLLANPICRDCDARVRHPLLPWLVGRRFFETSERLVFVGKPHRGIPGEILPSGIVDPRHSVQPGLWNSKWPYWRYTREIAENLYGENAFESIAMTNLIKCTNVAPGDLSQDQTSYLMAECCILRLGVILERTRVAGTENDCVLHARIVSTYAGFASDCSAGNYKGTGISKLRSPMRKETASLVGA